MQPLYLVGSTFWEPHVCHTQYMAIMGSICSLDMVVIINGNDDEGGRDKMKLQETLRFGCVPRYLSIGGSISSSL
jgi:hypothetical protein